jgi:hypothetical protein
MAMNMVLSFVVVGAPGAAADSPRTGVRLHPLLLTRRRPCGHRTAASGSSIDVNMGIYRSGRAGDAF